MGRAEGQNGFGKFIINEMTNLIGFYAQIKILFYDRAMLCVRWTMTFTFWTMPFWFTNQGSEESTI